MIAIVCTRALPTGAVSVQDRWMAGYKPSRAPIFIFVALVAALLALAAAWLSGGAYTSALPRPFDSERWKAAVAGSESRCAMIADLNYRIGVVGKTRAELVRLLGEPEDQDDDPASSHWALCPSFMDIYILEVRWHDERAVSAQVRDT